MRRGVRRPGMESPKSYRLVPTNSTPDMTIVKHEIETEVTPCPHLLDHGYGVTPQHQIMSSVVPNQAPAVKRKLNLDIQHIIVPIKHEFKPPQPKRPRRCTPPKKNTRFDTSLGLLTQKFTALLEESPDGVVDLNKASEKLNVQKRRIYDITNVLEGIGILEKKSKNNIQWKGGSKGSYAFERLKNEVKELENTENHLDRLISSAENELCKLNNDKYGYITYQDLRSIAKFKHKTVMAIKAPPNTQLSVPQDQEDKYNILMKSEAGEIEVFLCPEAVSPPKAKHIPPMDPLLKDIKLSPGLLDLKTPPVPLLDSPTPHKPISSQICRNLSFTKDPVPNDRAPSTSQKTILFSNTPASTSQSSDIDLNSLNFSPGPLRSILDGLSVTTTAIGAATSSPKHNVFLHYDNDCAGMESKYKDQSAGMLDPLFYAEPFVPLEPLSHSEYNFSLDSTEGLADLFDFL